MKVSNIKFSLQFFYCLKQKSQP